jgi:hypothetical protein
VCSIVQMGTGNASGIITDDSNTLDLDSWESELVGGDVWNCKQE